MLFCLPWKHWSTPLKVMTDEALKSKQRTWASRGIPPKKALWFIARRVVHGTARQGEPPSNPPISSIPLKAFVLRGRYAWPGSGARLETNLHEHEQSHSRSDAKT